MAQDYGETRGGGATVDLTDDQIEQIEQLTGVRVSQLEISSVLHSLEQAKAGEFGQRAGLAVVACW